MLPISRSAQPRRAARALVRTALPLAATLATLAACEQGKPAASAGAGAGAGAGVGSGAPAAAPGGRPVLPEAARVPLDSGNAAFRAGRLDDALRLYRVAAERAPSEAAPWYGVYMVAQSQGNPALADSAMAAVRARSRDAQVWNDSLMQRAHDGAAPGDGALPPGHPPAAAPGGGTAHPPVGVPPSPHAPVPARPGARPGATR